MRHAIKWYLKLFGKRFGPEFSRVHINEQEYLDRFILYVGGGTLRLHRFFRGDDARASHTHPWWFVTFPFASYHEAVYEKGVCVDPKHFVRAWRFHFRPANYEHIVLGRADGLAKPFWTFVMTGGVSNLWGFYPRPRHFVSYKEWA